MGELVSSELEEERSWESGAVDLLVVFFLFLF